MFTSNVADKLSSLPRLNCVILRPSMEYLGSLGLNTRKRIATTIAIITIKSSRRDIVQQKHLQRQLLFFLGGFECITGMVRWKGGYCSVGSLLSDFEAPRGTNGAVGVCGASGSWAGWILWGSAMDEMNESWEWWCKIIYLALYLSFRYSERERGWFWYRPVGGRAFVNGEGFIGKINCWSFLFLTLEVDGSLSWKSLSTYGGVLICFHAWKPFTDVNIQNMRLPR